MLVDDNHSEQLFPVLMVSDLFDELLLDLLDGQPRVKVEVLGDDLGTEVLQLLVSLLGEHGVG